MGIARMKKVQIFALRDDLQRLSKIIQELAILEVSSYDDLEIESTPINERSNQHLSQINELDRNLADITRSLTFLDQVSPAKPNVIEQFAGIKTYLTPTQNQHYLTKTTRLNELVAELQLYESELNRILSERQKILTLQESLIPWQQLDLKWENLQGDAIIQTILGAAPLDSFELDTVFQEVNCPFYLELIGENKNNTLFLLSFERKNISEIQQFLSRINVSTVQLPDYGSSVRGKLEQLAAELAQNKNAEQNIRAHVEGLNKERFLLQVFYDYYLSEKIRLESADQFLYSKRSFGIIGWIPANQISRLEDELSKKKIQFVLEEIEPQADEEPPTIIRNNALTTPFEYLVHSFSLPQYREIDPTPVVAPFFFIFFGIALGDAGYGLLLALFCAGLLIKLKMGPIGRRISWMFLISGVGAIIFGIITGSVLSLQNLKFGIFNPLENPILLLLIALGLGVIQLFLGLLISAYATIRDGRWVDAVCNQGTLIFFLAMALIVLAKDAIGLTLYSEQLLYLLLIAGASMVIANTRGKRGIGGFVGGILGGFYNIYGTIGFFSDILSYSRLMALGLSGGVMGGIMNQLAWMLVEGVPFMGLGWILGAAVFLFGHSLNLALSVLGAYVHSSRLQYLEFFGKFFEGGGKPFTPLQNKQKYTFVINEREAQS